MKLVELECSKPDQKIIEGFRRVSSATAHEGLRSGRNLQVQNNG